MISATEQLQQLRIKLADSEGMVTRRNLVIDELQAKNEELLSVLRDCESYAHAMGKLNNSGEGAQLAARCRELIAKAEGNTGSGRMCSCVECVPNGPDGPVKYGWVTGLRILINLNSDSGRT